MDGVRVVMLIDRGIMNSNKGSKRWINKIITSCKDEFIEATFSLMELQDHIGNPNIRLYSCLNDRKIDKAIALFKHKQIDLQDDMKLKFYCKINNSFASCLMQPENKSSKLFLLDADSKEDLEVERFIESYSIVTRKSYPTKNGWHYIVEPFNVKLAENCKTFEVKKDGLILLRYLEEKSNG